MLRGGFSCVLALLVCCMFFGCSGVQTGAVGNSPGGFKIVDGPRGAPATLYFTEVIHQLGEGLQGGYKKRFEMTFDPKMADEFGLEIVNSDCEGMKGPALAKSIIKFIPIGAKQYVYLQGGTAADRQYSGNYIPGNRFREESARWLKLLNGRDPSKGLDIKEYESATN